MVVKIAIAFCIGILIPYWFGRKVVRFIEGEKPKLFHWLQYVGCWIAGVIPLMLIFLLVGEIACLVFGISDNNLLIKL
jgi:hypothetical protein